MALRRRIGRAIVLAPVLALANRASAESGESAPVRPIHVVLSETLPEECAGTTPLFERVAARTDRIRRVTTDADAVVRLVVRREGDRLLGDLTVEEGAGRTDRTVSASTCEDLVAAFAVMVVVALDPDAEGLAPRRVAPPPREHPRAQVRLRPSSSSSPPRKSGAGPAIGLSGGVGLALPTYEGPVFEGSAMLELRIETPFYPRLRAAVARSEHVAVVTSSDHVDLVWTTGRASFCGGPGWLHRHHLGLCAGASMGVLDATVARPEGPARSLLWITAGPSIVLDLDLGWKLGLEIEAGLSVPALRDRFFFEPSTLAYEAPVAFPFIGVTLLSHFFRSRELGARSKIQ